MAAQKVFVAYFSGTGGTAMAARSLAAALEERGAIVLLEEIRTGTAIQNGSEDYLVLLFAVHAFNAPQPVYIWLDSLDAVSGTSAAVIAVSGGGEVSPNTAMRQSSIRRLLKKGYNVIYEDGIVMPSNFLTQTPEAAVARLFRALPEKTEQLADGILAGREKRLKAKLIDRILSRLGEVEKAGARRFGKRLFADGQCNGCGWCADNCPAGNINMENGEPAFQRNCCMCLRCIYGCPKKAIKVRFLNFIILKTGFDIKSLAKIKESERGAEIKGIAWKGVRRYLEDVERCGK